MRQETLEIVTKKKIFLVGRNDYNNISSENSNSDNKNSNINPLSANPTKCSNTLKQFVGNLPMNCLSVFDHFLEFALKGLTLLVSQ